MDFEISVQMRWTETLARQTNYYGQNVKRMKAAVKILGILWIAICGYSCISLSFAVYTYGLNWLTPFFMLLNLIGTVASVYVFRVSRRANMIVVGVVALLTVYANVMGFFAWFSAWPFSFIGITFDIFALASIVILLLSRNRKYAAV
jgi:hypothetical protein